MKYFEITNRSKPSRCLRSNHMGSGRSQLIQAIKTGEPDKVNLLLSNSSFNVHVEDFNEIFSMFANEKKTNLYIAKILISYGLNNFADSLVPRKFNLYRWAVKQNSPAIVATLLDAGMSVHEKIDYYNTLLTYAVEKRRTSIVSLLLSRGAKVNTKARCGQCALHVAVLKNDEDMVRLLLDNGADVAKTSNKKENCLHFATISEYGTKKIAEMLIKKGACLNAKNIHDCTPLHYAVDEEDEDLVKLFIDYGADIDALSQYGTPLFHATEFGNLSMVKLLLKKGANVNKGLATPLHSACELNDVNMIDILLKYGADINAKEEESGLTPVTSPLKLEKPSKLLIVKHVANLTLRNLFVDEQNMKYIQADKDMHKLYQQCYEELRNMTTNKIYGNITYYYFLTNEIRKLLPLFRNKEFVQSFKTEKITELFPSYENELKRIFKKCLHKNNVIRRMKKSFEFKLAIVFPFQTLPEFVKDRIFYYYYYY